MTGVFEGLVHRQLAAGNAPSRFQGEAEATLRALATDPLEVAKFTFGDLHVSLFVDGFSDQHGDFDGRRTVSMSRLPRARSVFVDNFHMIPHGKHAIDQPIAVHG